MKLPISPPVLLQELDAAKVILVKWLEAVAGGIPMIDLPADEDALAEFLRELCGELLLVAGKCETLAQVLYGSGG